MSNGDNGALPPPPPPLRRLTSKNNSNANEGGRQVSVGRSLNLNQASTSNVTSRSKGKGKQVNTNGNGNTSSSSDSGHTRSSHTEIHNNHSNHARTSSTSTSHQERNTNHSRTPSTLSELNRNGGGRHQHTTSTSQALRQQPIPPMVQPPPPQDVFQPVTTTTQGRFQPRGTTRSRYNDFLHARKERKVDTEQQRYTQRILRRVEKVSTYILVGLGWECFIIGGKWIEVRWYYVGVEDWRYIDMQVVQEWMQSWMYSFSRLGVLVNSPSNRLAFVVIGQGGCPQAPL